MMMKKKRKDECMFCSSRNNHARIVREEAPYYDEIACYNHINELEKHSDETLGSHNGIMRNHIISTGKLKRGEKLNYEKH